MPSEAKMLAAIEREPGDDLAWLALADCLEENGEEQRAELVRVREWLRFADMKDRKRVSKEKRLAKLLLAGVRPSLPLRTLELGKGVTLELMLIPPGRFLMGSPPNEKGRWPEEGPRHPVRITRPFWLGRFPLTLAQWQTLMPKKRSHGQGAGASHPVSQVDWHDATACCARLTDQAGVVVRLPTEAELEYATRASSKTPTYLGSFEKGADAAGWHYDNSMQKTHPVGGKSPNAWGLYDMLGNVWNWCADGPRVYSHEEMSDPRGPDGNMRSIKGASYKSLSFRCRSAARYPYADHYSFDDLGFRVLVEHG